MARHTWFKNTATSGGKVLRSTSYPDNQCCGCGTKRGLTRSNGYLHCRKPACTRKAAGG